MDYVKDFGEHNLMYDDHFDQSYLDTSVQKSVLINHSSYAQLYVTYPTCTFNLFLYPDNIFYILYKCDHKIPGHLLLCLCII